MKQGYNSKSKCQMKLIENNIEEFKLYKLRTGLPQLIGELVELSHASHLSLQKHKKKKKSRKKLLYFSCKHTNGCDDHLQTSS